MRGRPDGVSEVRLADSTRRPGEPATGGSGQQGLNRSGDTWAPFNGRSRSSMQREESPAMRTGLDRIAAKARSEPKLRFTTLAHHITEARVWDSLCDIPTNTAPGCDGKTVIEEKAAFGEWIEPMLRSVHRRCYRPPPVRRVYIPKPGKHEHRPIGVPCIADRALQI